MSQNLTFGVPGVYHFPLKGTRSERQVPSEKGDEGMRELIWGFP